jgi:uncharacterized membrane protein YkvA (DUF1232 family)
MLTAIGLTVASLTIAWIVLVACIFAFRPDRASIPDLLRLLPDTIRLVRRLATDRALPRATRWSVWMLLAYLMSPIDLVPDFFPVIGYADDFIITSIVLRRLVRRAGPEKLAEHWPGTPDGLAQLQRLLRLPQAP